MVKELFLLFSAAIGALFTPTAAPQQRETIEGNGIRKEETRPVRSFSKVKLEGAYKVDLGVGDGPSLKISADSNILPIVLSSVEGDTLIVKFKEMKNVNIRNLNEIKVWIGAPRLSNLYVGGAIEVKGSGIKADNFNFDAHGACTVDLKGSARNLDAELQGACRLNWSNLDLDSLRLNASGASGATLSGKADRANLVAEGASSFNLRNLIVGEAKVSIQGVSSSQVNVSGTLTGDVSGMSSLTNYGGARGAVRKDRMSAYRRKN